MVSIECMLAEIAVVPHEPRLISDKVTLGYLSLQISLEEPVVSNELGLPHLMQSPILIHVIYRSALMSTITPSR